MNRRPDLLLSPPRDPWHTLRRFTDARIALGRAGVSLPTEAHLAFQLAHAQARDAVHAGTDWNRIQSMIEAFGLEYLRLHSRAADRHVYLQRPDLGRHLDEASRATLSAWWQTGAPAPLGCLADGRTIRHDLAIVVADGLSAYAIERQATPLIAALQALLAGAGWRLAPVTLVEQGRVAIGDEIGEALQAAIVVVLIGERPGLSSPDSLGIYFTHAPRAGLPDAARNCISNVRPAGLTISLAARRLFSLLTESRRRGLSGVALKDETESASLPVTASRNFLTVDS